MSLFCFFYYCMPALSLHGMSKNNNSTCQQKSKTMMSMIPSHSMTSLALNRQTRSQVILWKISSSFLCWGKEERTEGAFPLHTLGKESNGSESGGC